MLIPTDERIFHGDFYTPPLVVQKAYDKLEQLLGEGWQEEYTVCDPCCGMGNLEARDVNIMHVSHLCPQAVKFKYDYLNDDIAEDGSIDYNMTNTLPVALRKAIEEARTGNSQRVKRKLLILMDPPYAEATNANKRRRRRAKQRTRREWQAAQGLPRGLWQ